MSKEAAPGKSKSKKPDPVKAATSKSVSAVRATLRAGHHNSSANSRDEAQKKCNEDPEFAANYMANMSRQAVGVDVWSRTSQTLGGFFCQHISFIVDF